MSLDNKGREFGEQGRVPDCVKSTRYMSGYGSDFMSGIEDLHPLLGMQNQHIQGRMTWSESKLMVPIKAGCVEGSDGFILKKGVQGVPIKPGGVR